VTSTATTAATNGRLPAGTDLEDLFGVEIDQTAATPQEDVRLAKYDAACVALAEAHRVEEAREIRDRAVAVRAYAKQARNTELARWAVEIQLRAERRCGGGKALGIDHPDEGGHFARMIDHCANNEQNSRVIVKLQVLTI
jgi:hypothetical protein